MGYGFYHLPDGREAGYSVEAECDVESCHAEIDRGIAYLCGDMPDGWRSGSDYGCGNYFCGEHQFDHECANPMCETFSEDEELCCDLARGHDIPHSDSGVSFTKE